MSGRRTGRRSVEGYVRRFDYGFALEPLEHDIPASPQRIKIQDRCYNGGYLGTSDPDKICAVASRAMFWDSVHPTTYTHCWLAWFVQAQMAQTGFLASAPTVEANRRLCEGAIH